MSENKSENKFVGEIETPEGKLGVRAFIAIKRDERETVVFKLADDSFGFVTKSWLLQNERQEVTHQMRFTETTFVMLLEAMLLAADYFKLDMADGIKKLATDGNQISFECGGNGEFNLHCDDESKA